MLGASATSPGAALMMRPYGARRPAAALPDIEEFRYLAAGALAEWSERARIEIDAIPEDGKLAPITSESERARCNAACERHRPGIYRKNAAYRELVGAVCAFGAAGAREPAARRRFAAALVGFPRPGLGPAPAVSVSG